MKKKKENKEHLEEARLRKKLDEQLYNNLPPKKVSWFYDINIKKYKPRGSYRGDSPLDD